MLATFKNRPLSGYAVGAQSWQQRGLQRCPWLRPSSGRCVANLMCGLAAHQGRVGAAPRAAAAAVGGANEATRLLQDVAARQFWEKYFGEDKECDFSFFWECLCDEYSSILTADFTDKEHENLFKGEWQHPNHCHLDFSHPLAELVCSWHVCSHD